MSFSLHNMNIVVEHIWDFVQKKSTWSRQVTPMCPDSAEQIMLNTMADLCIGGELWCESSEPDFGFDMGMELNGKNRMRKGRMGRRFKGTRNRMVRNGLMRSTYMRHTMINSSMLQNGFTSVSTHTVTLHSNTEYSVSRELKEAVEPVVTEEKVSTIECFAEIVSIAYYAYQDI